MKYKGVPVGGWEERTWYLVEVAFSANNVIHRALFYTGFLNNPKSRVPCGYNCFISLHGLYEDPLEYIDAYHLVPIRKLFSEQDLDGKCQGTTPEMLEQERKEKSDGLPQGSGGL